MSRVPKPFLGSDDEEKWDSTQAARPRSDHTPRIEAMTINAGTSTTRISDSNVHSKNQEPSQAIIHDRETTDTFHHVSRKMDEIIKMLSLLNGRQQAIYGVVVDIKKELDILKSSSARFASATATSGVKSVKKPKFLYDK